MRACVHACVRACVRARARACVFIQRAALLFTSPAGCSSPRRTSPLPHLHPPPLPHLPTPPGRARAQWDYAIALFLTGLLCTALGQVATLYIHTVFKSRSLVVIVMACTMGASAVVMAGQSYAITAQAARQHTLWAWGNLCGAHQG